MTDAPNKHANGSPPVRWSCVCYWSIEAAVLLAAGEVDADVAIAPADVLSRQALEAQAEDLALEDALYSLDKALQDAIIPPEVYMKQVLS